jgi:hypothetical protein
VHRSRDRGRGRATRTGGPALRPTRRAHVQPAEPRPVARGHRHPPRRAEPGNEAQRAVRAADPGGLPAHQATNSTHCDSSQSNQCRTVVKKWSRGASAPRILNPALSRCRRRSILNVLVKRRWPSEVVVPHRGCCPGAVPRGR